jgi:hypothetical protein
MMTEIRYTNIKHILDEIHRHPLLEDVTLEQVVSYLVTFIGLFGMPKLYVDKEIKLAIVNHRALLPCDLVSIKQVKNCKTNVCMRATTDSFNPEDKESRYDDETFKTQGTVIFTSFKDGDILIAYSAIPVDDDGYPLLIDNPVFLEAFRLYIKKEVFQILFDTNKISAQVLQSAQQQYCWLAGQLHSEFTIPSYSEMESLKNSWCTLVQRVTEFRSGFKYLGSEEFIRKQ